MAPPELATNAPVPDVVEPVEIDFVEPLRHDLDAALVHRRPCRFRKRLHSYVPLFRHQRFDDFIAALAVTHRMAVRFDLF